MKKRIIAIALVLLMALTLLPMAAFADDGIYVSVGGKEFTSFGQTFKIGGGTAQLSTSGEFPALVLENVNLTQFLTLGTGENGVKYYAGIVYAGDSMLCIYCNGCTVSMPQHGSEAVYEGIFADGPIKLMGNLTIKNADIGIEGTSIQGSGSNVSISSTTGPAIMADEIKLVGGGVYAQSNASCAIVASSFYNSGVTTVNHTPDLAKYGYESTAAIYVEGTANLAKTTVNLTADFSGYTGTEYLTCSAITANAAEFYGDVTCNLNVKGCATSIVEGIFADNLYCCENHIMNCHLNLSGDHEGAVGIACNVLNKYYVGCMRIESVIKGGKADDAAVYIYEYGKTFWANEIYASVDHPDGDAIVIAPEYEGIFSDSNGKTPLNLHVPQNGSFAVVEEEGISMLTVTDENGQVSNVAVLNKNSYPFRDIDGANTAPYKTAILWAVDKGVTSGFTPVEFRPDAPCTRGQVVTFLWRANGCPEPETTVNPFVDVASTSPYYKAILWAYESGVTAGTDATHFSPSAPCTRGQVVTFLWRAEGKPMATSEENPFSDVSATGKTAPYYNAILWAVENGITSGYADNTFRPGKTCSRGQIVTFIYRDMQE